MPESPSQRYVAIIGASSKEDRYAHRAQQLLMEKGYPVLPVSRRESEILGVRTCASINDIRQPVDTVTLYVGPRHQQDLISQIVTLKPKRVIFNPGTENAEAFAAFEEAGIEYEEACTLVLLRTGQF